MARTRLVGFGLNIFVLVGYLQLIPFAKDDMSFVAGFRSWWKNRSQLPDILLYRSIVMLEFPMQWP
jgi:hypothetical protein